MDHLHISNNNRKKITLLLLSSIPLTLAGCGFFGSVNPYQNSYTNWVEDYSTGGALAGSTTGYVGQPLSNANTTYNSNIAVAGPAVNDYQVANTSSSVYVPAPIQTTQIVGQPLSTAPVIQNTTANQPITIEPLQSEVLIEPIAIVEPTIEVTQPAIEVAQPIVVAPAVQTTVSANASDVLKTSATSKKGNWLWPVDGGKVYRAYNPGKTGSKGALLKANIGSTVRAANSGEVVYVGHDLPGLGNLIIISHDNSLASGYGYVSGISVNEGDTVKQGQAIAVVEGINSQEPVLHFEVRKNNEAVNPVSYVKKR